MKRLYILLFEIIVIFITLGLVYLNCDSVKIRLVMVILYFSLLLLDFIDTTIIVIKIHNSDLYCKYFYAGFLLVPLSVAILLSTDYDKHIIIAGTVLVVYDIYNVLYNKYFNDYNTYSKVKYPNLFGALITIPPKIVIGILAIYVGSSGYYKNDYYDHEIPAFKEANTNIAGKVYS